MAEKACKGCRYVTIEGTACVACGSTDLTEKWNNYVYIEDPEKSEIAKSIGAKAPGKYALNIKM
ncbi:MAG: DNA-directed RNA polymerase, subunit E'' [Candidatus ainarchaeum sp.]|nr:DNA-directed RNA polymerase, subunit E'' [Candidatus ainarchaeum sp.]